MYLVLAYLLGLALSATALWELHSRGVWTDKDELLWSWLVGAAIGFVILVVLSFT